MKKADKGKKETYCFYLIIIMKTYCKVRPLKQIL